MSRRGSSTQPKTERVPLRQKVIAWAFIAMLVLSTLVAIALTFQREG